jgi:hypothetical protein
VTQVFVVRNCVRKKSNKHERNNNMPTTQVNMIQQFTPNNIAKTHPLAMATTAAAASFALGAQTISVKINKKTPPAAIVNKFELSAAAAKKLNRSDNVIEGIASAIQATTVQVVKTYLARVNVPVNIANKSQFYFVSIRRRDTASAATPAEALVLSNRFPSAGKQNFILGLSQDKGKNLIAALVHPSYQKGGKLWKGGVTVVTIPPAGSSGTQSPPAATPHPDPDNTQDFAACYSACMQQIPPFLLALAGGVCSTCGATIALAAGTVGGGGITAGAVAVACVACAVAIGIVLGNCLLNCHEML